MFEHWELCIRLSPGSFFKKIKQNILFTMRNKIKKESVMKTSLKHVEY